MNNKIKLLTLALFAGVAFTACEDNRDEFLEMYDTINLFKDSGETPLVVYNVGEDTKYQLTVNKGGSDLESTSSVYVTTMTEPVLQIYNEENFTDYVMLPDESYSFESREVTLTKEKPYEEIEVTLKTDFIKNLEEVAGKYVLPFELINSEDSINTEKKYVFLAPDIITPTVFFPTAMNDDIIFTAEDEQQISFTFPVAVPSDLENRWDLECTLGINEALVSEYNETYSASYSLLPEDAYTMPETVTILPGEENVEVEVFIDRNSLRFGNYLLPVELLSVSKPEFEVAENNNLFSTPISYTPPNPVEVPLTADMVSSNADEPNEGPIENLVDGDSETYFHSTYTANVFSPYGHYIDIKLTEAVDIMQFAYITRHNNPNGTPKHIVLYTSSDGQNWDELATINRGLPEGMEEEYISTVFQSEQSFTHLRLSVMESAGGIMNEEESAFFALAELQFFGELIE